MNERTRRAFDPPTLDNELETAEARKVWWLIVVLAAAVSMFFPLAAVFLRTYALRFFTVTLCFDCVFLAALMFVRRGRFQLGSALVVTASVFLVGAFTWTSGGVKSPGMIALPLFVGIAGILQGAWAAARTGIACIAISMALLIAEMSGHLPQPSAHYGPIATYIVFVFLTVTFVGVHLVGSWHVKLVEKSRREIAQRYREHFENAPVGIYRTTPQGEILDANPALLSLLGFESLEQLKRIALEEEQNYFPRYSRQEFRRAAEKGNISGLEAEWRRADGSTVFVRENARAIFNEEGRVLYYEGTLEDFTERKRLEAQSRQTSKMEAIGHLAGGIAHDFNNILGCLILNVGLMQRRPNLDPSLQASLKEINLQIRRASALTRRLLLFGRQNAIDMRPMDLNAHLDDLTRMLRQLVGENYELVIEHEARVLGVRADPSMIDQVVMNLCINARDAMPGGGRIVVRTSEVAAGAADPAQPSKQNAGRLVRMDVVDWGCGISDEAKKHLFELFYTTKDVGEGTGLGLATAYSVVQQHGGSIKVESTVGEGSCFSVFLPLLEAAVPHVHSEQERPIRKGTERVLLVEDDGPMRSVIRRFLEGFGYSVIEAESGQAALRQWEDCSGDVDMVLADIVLPGGMNGIEVVGRLKAARPALRVMLCSGYSSEMMDDQRAKSHGAIFLKKPFTVDELSAGIRECMARREN